MTPEERNCSAVRRQCRPALGHAAVGEGKDRSAVAPDRKQVGLSIRAIGDKHDVGVATDDGMAAHRRQATAGGQRQEREK